MSAELAALFPDSFEDSPLGKVPRGWGVVHLSEHLEAAKGLSYKGSGLSEEGKPLHNLNSVLEGGGYKYNGIKYYAGDYKPRHLLQPGDLIVTNTEQTFDFLLIGYPAIVPRCYGEEGLFSHHIFRVRPLVDSPIQPHFAYQLLMSPQVRDQIVGYTNGTTVNMLPFDGLQRPIFVMPPAELARRYEQAARPMYERIEYNEEQSRTLAALRDALLPRLLSGAVAVGAEGVVS
jgi:type I restriction enzyme S subunit